MTVVVLGHCISRSAHLRAGNNSVITTCCSQCCLSLLLQTTTSITMMTTVSRCFSRECVLDTVTCCSRQSNASKRSAPCKSISYCLFITHAMSPFICGFYFSQSCQLIVTMPAARIYKNISASRYKQHASMPPQ